MKSLATYLGIAMLVWGFACNKLTEAPGPVPFESQTGPLPTFSVVIDSVHRSQTLRFDSIAQGGNFSIQFTLLRFGKIRIVEQGKAVQLQMDTGRWEKDSSKYTICKNQVCREGWLRIRNLSYVPVPVDTTDTTDTLPSACVVLATRTLFTGFSSTLAVRRLFPTGVTGTIDSVRADTYQVSIAEDSNLVYATTPIPDDQLWAWDTIRYTATSTSGQCYRAKVAMVIGNTCEPEARADFFSLPTGSALWPEAVLTANDTGCTGTPGSYQTRTPYLPPVEWDYGSFKVMNTANGVLVDTLVGGVQHYKYRRTNAAAAEDGFWYYFKNLVTSRVTRAWVKITF